MGSYAVSVLLADVREDAHPADAARLAAAMQAVGFSVLPPLAKNLVGRIPNIDTETERNRAVANVLYAHPDLLKLARESCASYLVRHSDQFDSETIAEIDAAMRIKLRKPVAQVI